MIVELGCPPVYWAGVTTLICIITDDALHIFRNSMTLASVGGAQYIHVDVLDGHFVPNISIGQPVVKSIRDKTDLILDVHLMIENPELCLEDFLSLQGYKGIVSLVVQN